MTGRVNTTTYTICFHQIQKCSVTIHMQDTQKSLQTLWVSICDLCVCSEPIVVIGIPNGHQTKERVSKNVCFFILHALL
jgi:hypothetical protein